MPKVTLSTIGSRYGSIDALNNNFDEIEDAIENTLSRDGTSPNEMLANLNMGGNRIINVDEATASGDAVNLGQLSSIVASANQLIGVFKYEPTISDGQTVVSTYYTYTPSRNNLKVFVNGVLYTAPSDYTETSNTSVTFTTALTALDKVVFFIGDIINNTNVDPTIRPELAAPTGAGTVGTIAAGTGATARTVESKLREFVSVKDFGAVGDGVVDDRVAIQLAIDYASANSLMLYVPAGVYMIGSAGVYGGRAYGLELKSNLCIEGAGEDVSVFRTLTGVDIDLVITRRDAPLSNITLRKLALDGNADGTNLDLTGFNLWVYDVSYFKLENVKSLYPESWGLRIQLCDNVTLNNIACLHDSATNSDGIHFVDCNTVTVNNVDVYTAGDDAFIIEALNTDIADYAISGVIATSTVARGILVFSDPAIVAGARKISNINMSSIVVRDCMDESIILQGASFFNIAIDGVVQGGKNGLLIEPGTALYPSATVTNCRFDLLVRDTTQTGILPIMIHSAVYKNNTLNASVWNPGNGFPGVNLQGNYWKGRLVVDYNPNSDKTLFSSGVLVQGSFNEIGVTSFDAGENLVVSDGSTSNSITIGILTGGVTRDLRIGGTANRNLIMGGKIAGAIDLGGNTTTRFADVEGATFARREVLNLSTLGTGDVVLTHGLNGTPSFVSATLQSSALVGHVQPYSITSTTITFRVWNSASTLVTSGSYTVNLDVRL
jgi:hypothetical protein